MMVLDELLELGEKSVGLNPDDAQRQVLLKSESVANKIKYALESDEFNKNLQELIKSITKIIGVSINTMIDGLEKSGIGNHISNLIVESLHKGGKIGFQALLTPLKAVPLFDAILATINLVSSIVIFGAARGAQVIKILNMFFKTSLDTVEKTAPPLIKTINSVRKFIDFAENLVSEPSVEATNLLNASNKPISKIVRDPAIKYANK